MDDPGLAQLRLALTDYCDIILESESRLEGDEVTLTVHWLYRGHEFRARLVVPPGRRIRLSAWLLWRLRGRKFRHLPAPPSFEWYNQRGWHCVDSVSHWRGILVAVAGDAPDSASGESTGFPARPHPGLPSLDAGAAAVPSREDNVSSHYPVMVLRLPRKE